MIDEVEVENTEEIQTETPPVETPKVPKNLPEDQEWGHVDFADPAVQKRFNRMYAQIKSQERIQAQLAADNASLAEKLAAIENKTLTNDYETTYKTMKEARKRAWMEGNIDLADELDEKLFELRTTNPKYNEPVTAPVNVPTVPAVIQHRIGEWISEKDETGELVRPYAHPNHPKYNQFKQIVAGIMADGNLATTILSADDAYAEDVSAIFDKVDSAMVALGLGKGKAKQRVQPSVTPSSPKVTSTVAKTGLTGDEIKVAQMMYRGDPDPIARYKKAKELVKK